MYPGRKVWELLAQRLNNAQIAERLELSDKTVRNHVSNIFNKPRWSIGHK